MIERHWGGNGCPLHVAVSKWVSKHSFGHDENTWPDASSMAVTDGGKPIAGVVFHDYKPDAGTVQYSGAAIDSRWLQGPTLHEMFGYMFEQLGCQMVITGNAANNTGLHSILERLDHNKHIIERGWGRGMDLYLWTLTREQWAANKYMKRSKQRAQEA